MSLEFSIEEKLEQLETVFESAIVNLNKMVSSFAEGGLKEHFFSILCQEKIMTNAVADLCVIAKKFGDLCGQQIEEQEKKREKWQQELHEAGIPTYKYGYRSDVAGN